MRFTRKDLDRQVADLNKRYCNGTKHTLRVSGAYGGYQVQLTGKRRKDGKGWRGYLGSGVSEITRGYVSAREASDELARRTYSGELKRKINYWEKCKR